MPCFCYTTHWVSSQLLPSTLNSRVKQKSQVVKPQMLSSTRSQKNWFQLLTAIAAIGSMLQSPAVLAEGNAPRLINQAAYSYSDSASGVTIEGSSSAIVAQELVDPLGRITGCNGEILPDYNGFSVNVYEADPSDPTGAGIKGLVPLTRTEVPDIPNNNISLGLAPNIENSNPYFLGNSQDGTYSFLLDPNKGQLDPGRSYVLLIQPPEDSIYQQRRVRIVINERNGDIVSYTATSLDGKAISSTDDATTETETINIRDAARVGLVFALLDFQSSICQSQEVQIIKTGDRAAAEPGDTVIYRLSLRNLASAPLNNIVATDTLPLGFDFLPKSVRGQIGNTNIPINVSHNGSVITFRAEGVTLPPATEGQNQVLNIAYAAQLTADSIRGTGENSAIVTAQRLGSNQSIKDGPATHKLRINPGILSDCGTVIGRVFVDKNFDGEQQKGEPGVPNAVIFMDDGNRITTDPNGLFSVANVFSGYRTGVLDLSSLPGYTLAPNRKFSERNSQSRLVHLEPGGLVRMNFAVTPTFQEGNHK